MRRYFLLTLIIAATVASCSTGNEDANDLAKIEAKLKKKKEQMRELQEEINALEEQRAELNPAIVAGKSVRVDTITIRSFKTYYEAQGVAESKENIILGSETNGAVQSIPVTEGQRVSRGQVIANVDANVIMQNIQEVKTQLELATTAYERQKQLWDQNIGSEFQFLEAKNRKESLEKRLNSLFAQYNKSIIKAPFSGTIDEIFIKEGETVMPGMRVARIVNLDKMRFTADVSESRLGTIKKGDSVTVIFPSIGYEDKAVVSAVGQVINPANRTFKVEVGLDNKNLQIKPNLLGSIIVEEYSTDSAVVIDQSLVQQDRQGNKFIYKLNTQTDSLIAQKTPIRTSKNYKGLVQVEQGLNAGDVIITTGSKEISDKEAIQIHR